MKKIHEDIILLHTRKYDLFVILGPFFLSFCPANNPENQLLGKIKTRHGDIIILRMRTLNDNHIMYGS